MPIRPAIAAIAFAAVFWPLTTHPAWPEKPVRVAVTSAAGGWGPALKAADLKP